MEKLNENVEELATSPSNEVGVVSQATREKVAVILIMGLAAGMANMEHGPLAVVTAGMKQAAYSGVSALFLLSLYDELAKRVKTLPGELVPIIIPTLVTITANYAVHNLRGTAEPLLSTLPTATVATLGFPIWHLRTRLNELGLLIEKCDLT